MAEAIEIKTAVLGRDAGSRYVKGRTVTTDPSAPRVADEGPLRVDRGRFATWEHEGFFEAPADAPARKGRRKPIDPPAEIPAEEAQE